MTNELRVVLGEYDTSWHDPVTDHWFQETFFQGNTPKFRDLGQLTASAKSFRRQIYDVTHEAFAARRPKGKELAAASNALDAAAESTESKAAQWRKQITSLKKAKA